jgi:hypothetical protein
MYHSSIDLQISHAVREAQFPRKTRHPGTAIPLWPQVLPSKQQQLPSPYHTSHTAPKSRKFARIGHNLHVFALHFRMETLSPVSRLIANVYRIHPTSPYHRIITQNAAKTRSIIIL